MFRNLFMLMSATNAYRLSVSQIAHKSRPEEQPMSCASFFFETSSTFPVIFIAYALVFSGKSSNVCFDQLLEVLQ